MTSFHEYALKNGNVLGDVTSPTRDLLDLSQPPVNLGNTVVISKDGSTAFVGSKKSKSNQYIGDVFIYSFNTSTYSWDYVTNIYSISNTDLTNHQSGSQYLSGFGSNGICCSSDGTILAVGASNFRENNVAKGAVFIYEKTQSGWTYRQRLILSDNTNLKFGYSMCCDDDVNKLYIGSDATSTLTNVYLYEKNTSSSTLSYTRNTSFNIKTLAGFGSGTNANFGTSLDCDSTGNYLVVGSFFYMQLVNGQIRYPGEVQFFLYDNDNDTWSLKQSLYSDVVSNNSSLVLANGSNLGNKVSITSDKTKLMIGTTTGYTFYYEYNSSSGTYDFVKTYNSSVSDNGFGKDFVISKDGNYLLIGQTDDNVFVYRYNSSSSSNPWILDTTTNIMTLASTNNSGYSGHYNDNFGTKLAINEDATRMLLGIPGFKSDGTKISGQAMFLYGKKEPTLTLNDISATYQSTVTLSPTTTSDASPSYTAVTSNQTIFTLSGSTLTITDIGTTQMAVTVSGSSVFKDKTITVNVTGNKKNQTITYTAAIDTTGSVGVGSTSGINFSSDSGLTVAMSHDTAYMSFDSLTNEFTALQAGNTTVTLSQPGNAYYNAATSVNVLYTITTTNPTNPTNPIVATSIGDPHVYPIIGDCFELPSQPGVFRMLQGEDLCINTSTRKVTSSESREIDNYFEKLMQINPKDASLVSDGVFYDEIFIYSDHKTLHYNMKDMIINYDSKYFQKNIVKNGLDIKFRHSKYGIITLSIKYYKNPQIKYGLQLMLEDMSDELSGLFIYQYNPKMIDLDKLHDCSRRTLTYQHIKPNSEYVTFQKSKL